MLKPFLGQMATSSLSFGFVAGASALASQSGNLNWWSAITPASSLAALAPWMTGGGGRPRANNGGHGAPSGVGCWSTCGRSRATCTWASTSGHDAPMARWPGHCLRPRAQRRPPRATAATQGGPHTSSGCAWRLAATSTMNAPRLLSGASSAMRSFRR